MQKTSTLKSLTGFFLKAFFILVISPKPACSQSTGYSGTDFWFAFMQNYTNNNLQLSLYITSAMNGTSGTVSVPLLNWSTTYTVTANNITTVPIPLTIGGVYVADMSSEAVSRTGIHVTSNNPVTVYGMSREDATSDAFLAIPTISLGTSYLAIAPASSQGAWVANLSPAEYEIVGTQNTTTVTIKTTGRTANGKLPGTTWSVVLNKGETYQVKADGATDLSGTSITSDKPIALMGGSICPYVGNCAWCDHIIEETPPIYTWGKKFYAAQFEKKIAPDKIRVIASEAMTTYTFNGASITLLNAGDYQDQDLALGCEIIANKPVYVTQFCRGAECDGYPLVTDTDPMLLNIIPEEQWGTSYTFNTPAAGFTKNYVTIVAKQTDIPNVKLDNVSIPQANWTQIGVTNYYYTRPAVAIGKHNLTALNPVIAYVYGYADFDSYAYPGGGFLKSMLAAVPLQLTNFEVIQQGSAIKISWDVPNPEGIDHFEIEKSEGAVFSTLSRMQNGSSTSRNGGPFIYKDGDFSSGTLYYRIKQVMQNGDFSYSDVKQVSIKPVALQINYVNADKNKLKVSLSSFQDSQLQYYINDIAGRELVKGNLLSNNTEELEISLPSLEKGIYLLKIESGGNAAQYKFSLN